MKTKRPRMQTVTGEISFARRRADANRQAPDISVFLPVFNEEPNLPPLHEKPNQALAQLGRSAEIIYVDDGSSDGSPNILRQITPQDSRVRVIAPRPYPSQTTQMADGIQATAGA